MDKVTVALIEDENSKQLDPNQSAIKDSPAGSPQYMAPEICDFLRLPDGTLINPPLKIQTLGEFSKASYQ